MSEHTPGPWIGKKTGSGGQGLIYSEKDGRNVAVIYDERDIALIESAPELLACIRDILEADGNLYAMDFRRYRAAIASAEGGA